MTNETISSEKAETPMKLRLWNWKEYVSSCKVTDSMRLDHKDQIRYAKQDIERAKQEVTELKQALKVLKSNKPKNKLPTLQGYAEQVNEQRRIGIEHCSGVVENEDSLKVKEESQ